MPTNTLTPQTTNSHADQSRSAIDPDKIIWDDESINPDKVMWDEPIQAGGLRIDIEDNLQESLAERNRSISESLPKSIGKAVVQGIAQFPKSVWSGVEAVGDITGLKPVEEFGRKHRKEVEKTEQYFEPQQEGWKRYITDAMRVISHMGSTAAVTGGAGLLSTISAGAGAQKYVQSREEGYDMPHSAAAGLTQAFLEYVTEKAPIGILKKPGMKFLDRLWKGLVTDVPGELMATVGEMKAVDEGILGKSYSAKEYVDAIKDTLAVASLTTTGMTAGAHGLHKGIPPPASPPAEDNKGYVRQRQSTHKGLQIREPLEASIEEIADAVKDDQKKGLLQTPPVIQQTNKEEVPLPEEPISPVTTADDESIKKLAVQVAGEKETIPDYLIKPKMISIDEIWDKTPMDLDEMGHNSTTYLEDVKNNINEKLKPLINQYKSIKEKSQHKKELKTQIDALTQKIKDIEYEVNNDYAEHNIKLADVAKQKAIEHGITDEETLNAFIEDFLMESSTERPHIEYNHNKTLNQIFDEVVENYKNSDSEQEGKQSDKPLETKPVQEQPPVPKPEAVIEQETISEEKLLPESEPEKNIKSEIKREPSEEIQHVPEKPSLSVYEGLPQGTKDKFEKALSDKDVEKLSEYLDKTNKVLRGEFEKRTGLNLGKTQSQKDSVIKKWAGVKEQPQQNSSEPSDEQKGYDIISGKTQSEETAKEHASVTSPEKSSQVENEQKIEYTSSVEQKTETLKSEGGKEDVATARTKDIVQEPLEGIQADNVQRVGEFGGIGESDRGSSEIDKRGDEANREELVETGIHRESGERDRVGNDEGGIHPVERRGGGRRTGAVKVSGSGFNYRITDKDAIGKGGLKAKYHDNIEAIKTLKQLETESRKATPEEQAKLVKYVGWGGMPQTFDAYNREWQKEYSELKELLTEEEYTAARGSTLNAHYTLPEVISFMYDALTKMGFEGGKILEPSTGAGHFIGLMPKTLIDNSKITGIELDTITGKIASQLYQNEDIRIAGFEKVKIPDNFYNLAISNIPFGDYKLHDKRYNKYGFNIHDYFFAKALDVVKPGGVVAFITSRYTMDKKSRKVREYINERADLIDSIRLPNTTFKGNANTEVTTDIIILKKRKAGEPASGKQWLESKALQVKDENGYEREIYVNEYYHAKPEKMLGQMTATGSMYRDAEPTLIPDQRSIPDALKDALKGIPENIINQSASQIEQIPEESLEIIPESSDKVKEGAYTVIDEKLYQKIEGELVSQNIEQGKANRIKGMIQIRDQVNSLLNLQREITDNNKIKSEIKILNDIYDNFVKKYGRINSRINESLFRDDPEYPKLIALEIYNPDTGDYIGKANIFKERVIHIQKVIERVDTAKEALVVTLNEKGTINFERMSALTGKSAEELQTELEGLIYHDPNSDVWQTADDYLSGNVREKLEIARSAAKTESLYKVNIKALEAVQPVDLKFNEIESRLGSTWIPTHDIESFISELLDIPANYLKIHYSPSIALWTLEVDSRKKYYIDNNVNNTNKWGLERYPAIQLIDDVLNHKVPTIRDKVDENTTVVNVQLTEAAREKQHQIKEKFKKWIWENPERRERLVEKYNKELNNYRVRQFDGQHLTTPGIITNFTFRPHQKDAIWRIMQSGNTLLAHVVGAGKTAVMISSAMEMKRVGLIKKPMFVVPNHLLNQWGSEFLRLYPNANILLATKEDFAAKKRKTFVSKIVTGNWDAIIIAHSSFGKIRMSEKAIAEHIQQQINDITDAIAEMEEHKGSRIIKQLEKTKKKLEAKLQARVKEETKDNVITFEETGVDQLYIDEAHLFKNLFFATKMNRVAGLPNTESDRAFDLYVKTQYLFNTYKKGIVFATGTPISNSMAEMFTMQRYLQPNILKEYGLQHFDAWAANFGETVSSLELAPDGSGYRVKNRFAKFVNIPELMNLFRSVADVKTAEMLNLPVPKLKSGKSITIVAQSSERLKEYVKSLADRSEVIRNGRIDPSKDNMLKVTSDGRKAALDMRLVNPLEDDNPHSKVNIATKQILNIWKETKGSKSVQLVFLDISTPNTEGFNVYNDIKQKLINNGVPGKDIAFIHEADTEKKKEILFSKARKGDVRILFGSTEKMGAGTNVQNKLIALHHIDAPWRPSDLEQRDGRILRQGNENEEVQVYRYVTEGSFDAYMWQTLENKAKFIAQVMTNNTSARSAEDVENAALTYAEVKALASGNPFVMEKIKIDTEVRKLNMLKAQHTQSKFSLQAEIAQIPTRITALSNMINRYSKDLKRRIIPDKFEMAIGKTKYTERKDAGEKIIDIANVMKKSESEGAVKQIGAYAGFDIFIRNFQLTSILFAKGEGQYDGTISNSPAGTIQSLDHALNSIEKQINKYTTTINELNKRLQGLIEEEKATFPQEEHLDNLLKKQSDINNQLDLDKSEITEGLEDEDNGESVSEFKGKSTSKADAGGYADAKPPETKTEPLEAPVIELPELVAVATEIGKGRYPVVKRRLRARGGEAIGQYSIPGGIQLRADIFKDPVKAQKTLAHEIGHWVDALPQLTHSRGNVLGNIASLVKYLKTTLKATPRSPEKALTMPERNKIRNRLIKEEIEVEGRKFRDYITDREFRKYIDLQVKAKYKDEIAHEIKNRRLITRDEIMGELKKVTQLWKPFDETEDPNYTKYRYSPEELYADAISVLINNPKILRDNAPVFYRAVHRYIVNKPEIRKIYKNMRALIKAGPEAIQEERDRRFDAMLDRTEKEYAKSLEKDNQPMKMRIKGFITTVKKEMVDRYSPLYDTIKNPAIKAKVRNAIEDYLYRTSEGEAYFREVYDKAISKIQKAGIVEKDLAKYVYYLRVINERTDIANPEGHTSKTAQEGLDSLKRKLGDDKFNAMEDAMKRFWKIRKEIVIARLKEANLYSEDLMKKIENNAHYYTFDVEGYIAERYGRGESAKIFKQHGTLKGVLNPFTATLLKDMALLRAVNYKLAVKGSIDGLIQDGHYGSEIKEADTKITMLPGNKAMRTPREPSDHNFGLLTYMDNGKIKGYYVPKDVAVAFERNPIETWAVTRIMRAMSTPFREIFTRKRPGFWFFNIARDIPAAIKILPGASFHKFIPHLAKSVKSAAKGIHGYDATTQELLKGKGLIASVDRTGMTEEDTQFERMLVAHGLRSAKYDNVLSRGVNRLIAWLNFVGELSERTTKIAAYQYLKEQFPDMPREDIMHLVRWSGSPAFLVKGEASPITNSLLLFLNPAIQGNRIQYQTAKEHPLEYGIKSMKYTVLPKLLMFGAAAGLMGDDLKKLFAYIGSYDKINYTIIPLGWSENNKAVYLRIPQDEPGRILGGILWKTLTDLKSPKDALSVFDYTANQLPGINPALSIIGDTIYFFAAGKNPYDAFRGKFAVPEPIFKAKDHRSIVAFAKYLSNKSGLGVVYKFDTDNIDKIKSKLEEMLGYPVTSDIVGRFIKVSDSGLYESLMEPVEDLRTEKARESLDLSEAYVNLINDIPLSKWNEEQKAALAREVQESPAQFRRKLHKFKNLKYGSTLLKMLMSAQNNEERLAIIMKERELEADRK